MPGERQNLDAVSGNMECVRHRAYPSALEEEVMKDGETEFHRRFCGRWIDAKQVIQPEMYSFYDEADVEADVREVIHARGTGRIFSTDALKFRAACTRMLVSNAIGPAGSLAYEYLKSLHRPTLSSLDDALRGLGLLSSFYCDGPSLIGTTFDAAFEVHISSGVAVAPNALFDALFAAGEDTKVRDEAKAFAQKMEHIGPIHTVDTTTAVRILEGSFETTWLQTLVSDTLWLKTKDSLPIVSSFLAAAQELGLESARSYLLGLSSFCAYATREVVTGEFGTDASIAAETARIRSERGKNRKHSAAGIGRMRSKQEDRFGVLNGTDVYEANTISMSLLSASTTKGSVKLWHGNPQTARQRCSEAAMAVFPDATDQAEFNLLVTEKLYSRLEAMTDSIRHAVVSAFHTPPLSDALTEAGKASASQNVREMHVRIPGAPRGTWAGVASNFQRPTLTSNDGALLILLKQAKAVFLDRLRLAVQNRPICEHSPLFDSMERNAYMLINHPCVVLLPGILTPPFAGERYDDESLYSRLGFVLAHEFSHSVSSSGLWEEEKMQSLLTGYAESTLGEAVADVAATLALVNSGVVGNSTLCAHISQIWRGTPSA